MREGGAATRSAGRCSRRSARRVTGSATTPRATRVELGATRDPDAPRREIEDAQAALADFADADKLFRPYGAGGVLGPRLLSRAAVEHLCDGGYTCVLWNSVPRDWEDPRGWPERALADLRANEWTLLVLHDIPSGAMRALPDFLARARDAGVELTAELPPACVPILRGRVVGALEGSWGHYSIR